ncbi:TrmH family RNA methyltransferase [Fusobacterium sp. PH5-44]|uniref:TrmH family RNA methyltransferase n=1 Tax=unclassified Fusobacterium TaxID=2648384 RepID=UPI003D1EE13D
MEYIDSIENKFIKKIRKLKSKKYRDSYSLFLGEGIKFVDFHYTPYAIIIDKNAVFSKEHLEKLNSFITPKTYVSSKVFHSITTQENPQGIIFVYEYLPNSIESLGDNIVVLNNISDPGNLGTIIRVVDAVGYKDILISKSSVDMYNEKTVRSSMGSILNVNINYMESDEIINLLKEKNYKVFATNLDKSSIDYKQMLLSDKNAYIFGNEANGISDEMLNISDEHIIIPMYGSAQSLNVSIASAIILYKSRELLEIFNQG